MATDLQTRKRETMFATLDSNRDGAITESDIQAHVDGFLRTFNVPPNSPNGRKLQDSGRQIWQALSRLDSDGDQAISKAEYAKAIDDDLVENVFLPMNASFFDIIDENGDGQIDEQELTNALVRANLANRDIHQAFRKLDSDGDGSINRWEWDQAVREMLTSSDPDAAGSLILGL